jgi:hypothetical protein
MERDPLVIDLPLFGKLRGNLSGTVGRNEAIVEVCHDLVGLGFRRLMRIQRENLGKRSRNDELIGRRLGKGRWRAERHDGKSCANEQSGAKVFHRNSSQSEPRT